MVKGVHALSLSGERACRPGPKNRYTYEVGDVATSRPSLFLH
ncbi:hypothetical protein L083_2953 [Actinoplanes sp. N902-109]|nr:hypothetical protein L083_2953 [Actinoplanes sp. N902-109]